MRFSRSSETRGCPDTSRSGRLAVLAILILASCSRQAAPPQGSSSDASAALLAPHADGTPRRIVTISPSADLILCELGASDRIAGVSRFTPNLKELADYPRIGGLFDPDLERILALRPDLIILRGHNEDIQRLCAIHGIRLYLDPTEDIDSMSRCIRDLGRMLGVETQAAEVLARFHGRLDAAEALAASRRGATGARPRVLMTLGRNPDVLRDVMTSSRGTLHDDLIRRAGGDNVFGDMDIKFPTVAIEQIVARGPQIILELMPEVHVTDELRKRVLEQWSLAGPLPAVQSGRVVILGREYEDSLIPSPRIVELVEKLVNILYPPTTP